MVISSLIVETIADSLESVQAKVAATEGVEVHEVVDGYKIVITIEAETVDISHDIANSLAAITGVLGVNLVYVNFEDDPTLFPPEEREED